MTEEETVPVIPVVVVEEKKSKVKEYVISSLVTFLAMFSVTIVSQLDGVSGETISEGALVSLIFTGIRAAFKAVIEYLAGKATTALVK